MKQTYMPCIDCSYALHARNPELEKLWIWLSTDITVEQPYQVIFCGSGEDLHYGYEELEQMRFIITHEAIERWHVVKLLGLHEGSQLICVHRHIT